jgi:stearoyl-CoA desaturase (delta-9 desaturase)
MNQNEKIRLVQVINHYIAIGALVYVYVNSAWWLLLASILFGMLLNAVGINIGFHRYLTHQSFQVSPFVEKILLYAGTIAFIGSPLQMSLSHINHHAYADKEGDPYSPNRIKFWDFIRTKFEPIKNNRVGMRRLAENKTVMHLHKNYFTPIIIYCTVLFLIDPIYVVFFWCIPSLICLYSLLLGMIGCHTTGYRTYDTDDQSYNNILVSIFTLGEGWHNNHHKNPSEWNNQHKWWEIDISALIIKGIKK